MDPTAAMIAGLAAGLAIAMQVGVVSVLLVDAAIAAGPRAGVAAGMGVATADLVFAAIAVAAGGAAGAVLEGHAAEIRLGAGVVLAAIAIHGLVALWRRRTDDDGPGGSTARGHAAAGQYARFLTITLANPLTIVSFAAVAASLSLRGALAAVAFAAGVGLASSGWHILLSLGAGHAGRWFTPRIRRGLAIGGRLMVLAIAVHLAV